MLSVSVRTQHGWEHGKGLEYGREDQYVRRVSGGGKTVLLGKDVKPREEVEGPVRGSHGGVVTEGGLICKRRGVGSILGFQRNVRVRLRDGRRSRMGVRVIGVTE